MSILLLLKTCSSFLCKLNATQQSNKQIQKSNCSHPENYRSISLVIITGKIYAKYLAKVLGDWVINKNMLTEEQAGLRKIFNNWSWFCIGSSDK